MILDSLINIAIFILSTILAIFPSSQGFPSEVQVAIDWLAGYVGILDPIFPIQSLATVVSLVVTFELAVFAFKGFKWLFSHIPFIGGRG